MKNKTLIIIIIIIAGLLITSTVLANLGVLDEQANGDSKKHIEQVTSVDEMKKGYLYIWKDSKDKDEKALLAAKGNVFQLCPIEKSNFDKDGNGLHSALYTVWVNSDEDSEIPTLTSKDKLLYINSYGLPTEYNFQRLYDNGYTIGITSFIPDDDDHYFINYSSSTNRKAYKEYINMDSDAGDLDGYDVTRLYLDKVGGTKITEDYISTNGLVEGLKKDKVYTCEFYTGTMYQDFNLTANQHTFTAFENYTSYGYDFLHSNCISIDIPEWLRTGYYNINQMGMFRFVDDNDIGRYCGKSHDGNIDWNVPSMVYNEDGELVYDPSVEGEDVSEDSTYESTDDAYDTMEETDDTLGETEAASVAEETPPADAPQEALNADISEWSRKIPKGDKFTAEITISRIVNREPVTLTVTAPDGSTYDYTAENNKIIVEIFEPKDGEYTFKVEKLGGRIFTVKYSDGEVYYGPKNTGGGSQASTQEVQEEPDGDDAQEQE